MKSGDPETDGEERHLCPGCAEEVYESGQYCDRCRERSRQEPIFDESWGDLRPWMSGPQ